jgi:hypothetical protein
MNARRKRLTELLDLAAAVRTRHTARWRVAAARLPPMAS